MEKKKIDERRQIIDESYKTDIDNISRKLVPKPGDKIAVWFSSGAASAVAAKRTLDKYGDICDVRIVNNPIYNEDPDNLRFLQDVEKWLGVTIEYAKNKRYPKCDIEEVFEDRRYMSGIGGAPCTTALKKQARYEWEFLNRPDWHVLGFTAEEKGRYERFVINERGNTLPVLIEAGISKGECFLIISEAGIELPEIYKKGGPNANCPGCVKATSPTYWNWVRKVYPEVFKSRAEQSRDIGARLVIYKGKRIFLDELQEYATGRSIKNMNFECGIFCNTK